MKHIELEPSEFANFIRLAQAAKAKYHYTIVAGIILLSASEAFLTSIGY